jgi:hypothetical protein
LLGELEFGPPLFTSLLDLLVKIPLSKILPQVQFEVVHGGLDTIALGELPPYFISRAGIFFTFACKFVFRYHF